MMMVLDLVIRVLVVGAALNLSLIGLADFNVIEWIGDHTFEHVETTLYTLVGLSALALMLGRDYYLPYLGGSAFPCGSLAQKVPTNAVLDVTVKVKPNANVIFWSAEENDRVVKDPILAYAEYSNAGVVRSDQNGLAVLRVRKPAAYKIPSGKVLTPHIHYRTCDTDGMLGRVTTVYVGK